MATSTGSRARLGFIAEVTPGTTPLTPSLLALPFRQFGIELSKDVLEDPSIRSDRMEVYNRHGNKRVSGSAQFTHAPGTFDDFLAAAMYSDWATNVLKVGTTEKSFTLEHGQLDVDQYRVFTGCHVNSFKMSVPGNGLVNTEVNFIGTGGSLSGTPLDATVPNVTEGVPFVHLDGTFSEGGSTIGFMTAIEWTLENNLTANYALGSSSARSVTYGMSKIAGTVDAYFENGALVGKFINETESSLSYTLTSGAVSQTYLFPRVKFQSANVPVNSDGPVMVKLAFKALKDTAVENTLLKITRTV